MEIWIGTQEICMYSKESTGNAMSEHRIGTGTKIRNRNWNWD